VAIKGGSHFDTGCGFWMPERGSESGEMEEKGKVYVLRVG
jgi:membrane-bound lytic murein transglycosylase